MDNLQPQSGWKIDDGTFWLPKQSSTIAPEIDFGWDVAMYLAIVLFILVIVPMVLFVMRYRRKHADEIGAPTGHNTTIEIVWSVIPLAVVMGCFLVGFKGFMHASVAPANSYEIAVTAKKWAWVFTYPNGATTDELHVPANRPVKLVMSSQDVLHSFYVPEFRVKQDVVPGTYTTAWFEATEPKEYSLLCAEYCGTAHSAMLAKVVAHEQKEFDAWLEKAGRAGQDLAPDAYGKELFTKSGCNACHSVVPGQRLVGPSLGGIFGKNEKLHGGGEVPVDENYLRESILNPNAKVVDTFGPSSAMPPYKGQLKDNQVDALIAYIKTLK